MVEMGKGYLPLLYIPNGAGRYIKCPVLTTTQRDLLTGVEGMIIFNSTTDQLEEYDGSTWEAVGQIILDTHTADPDAHHSEEVAESRPLAGTTARLVIPGIGSSAMGTEGNSANVISYVPFRVRTPITVIGLYCEITTGGGGGTLFRMGIYAADTDLQPGALKYGSGELDAHTEVVVSVTGLSVSLDEGLYLTAFTTDGTPSTRTCLSGAFGLLGFVTTLGASPSAKNLYVSKSFAALSDPGTAWTGVNGGAATEHPIFLAITP